MSRDLVLLFVSLFTWGIGEGLFIYFQPIYLQELGASTMATAGIQSGVRGGKAKLNSAAVTRAASLTLPLFLRSKSHSVPMAKAKLTRAIPTALSP